MQHGRVKKVFDQEGILICGGGHIDEPARHCFIPLYSLFGRNEATEVTLFPQERNHLLPLSGSRRKVAIGQQGVFFGQAKKARCGPKERRSEKKSKWCEIALLF
jgi:hypothetical protein